MGTSYTEYNNFGFWSNDKFLAGLLYLVQKELKTNKPSSFLNIITEKLYDASTNEYAGCIPDYISDFDTNGKMESLRLALNIIIQNLKSENLVILEELNSHKVGGFIWNHLAKEDLLKTTNLLLKLINGELKTNASSIIDY